MATQAIKTVTKASKDLLNEYGRSGTRIMSGVINEEYNQELAGKRGIEIYDKMRKSDGTIQALLFACELPIRATEWYIESGETIDGEEVVSTDRNEEIKNFVEDALFNRMEGSFDDFLRQSLSKLTYGHSVFEKVYKIEDQKVYIKKLAQRLPRTIYAWKDDGIEQYITGDDRGATHVFLKNSKLIIFTFRQEGDNREGTSILRAAYKHWFIKDKLYKIDAVKHERQALGVPYIKLPTGAKAQDKKEAKQILANMRANENAFVVLPGSEWEAGFMDMNAGSTADVTTSIAHHDRQIAKSILAQFLELGAGEGGSYALSEDQSSLFLLSLTTIAENIREIVNKQLIKELVDLNFVLQPNETYPQLKYGKIGTVKYKELADTLSTLLSSGALSIDEDLEDHIRSIFDLPKKSEEEDVEEMDESEEAEGLEDPEDPENDPEDPEDVSAEQELLDSEMENLKASEMERIYSENESAYLFSEGLEESSLFRTISSEGKANISKGLIEYWKTRTKKTKPTTDQRNEGFRKKAKDAGDKIRQSVDQMKKQIEPLQNDIDAVKSSSLGKKAKAKKIKEIRAKIKAMRDSTNESLSTLKSIRRDSLQGARQTKDTIMRRKTAIKAMIKQVNDELKSRTSTRSESIKYLRDQVKANIENYNNLKRQAKSPEEKKNLKSFYQAIKSENESLRKAGQTIHDEITADKTQAKAKKEQITNDMNNKYSITDEIAQSLGFSDIEEMRIFAESKRSLEVDPIIQAQNEE